MNKWLTVFAVSILAFGLTIGGSYTAWGKGMKSTATDHLQRVRIKFFMV